MKDLYKGGVKQGCTAKGSACGTGGNYVKFVVPISYEKGVICVEPYHKMDGEYFAGFLRGNFEQLIKNSGKNSRCWIQDGDPSQNSSQAKQAMLEVKSDLLSIPPRSPDLNPIENVFKIAKAKLYEDVIERNITRESKLEFETRVKETPTSIDTAKIDNVISSMNGPLKQIANKKGERLSY